MAVGRKRRAKGRRPGRVPSKEVIPFHLWIQDQTEDLNLDDALERYTAEYNLLRPTKADEPLELTRIVARLKILEESKDKFSPDVRDDIDRYMFMLLSGLMMEEMKWEMHQKHEALEKRIDSGRKESE